MTDEPSRRLCWAAFFCVAVLLLLPLSVVDVPPLLDYPNHLARLFVLAHPDDAWASRYYAQDWTIVPNLAIDVLVPPLLRLLPVHVAGRIVIGATMLLPVVGCAVYSRAMFGRRSLWPLASALVAYNAPFLLGFLNFQITLGLALLMAAGWHAWSRRWPVAAALVGAVAATGLFFSHLFGLAFFAVLVGADELSALRTALGRRDPLPAHVARRGAMLATMFCAPVVLYFCAPLSGSASAAVWPPWSEKLRVLLSAFAFYWDMVTLLTAAAVVLSVYLFARAGNLRAAAGLPVAMATLFVVYLAAPAVAMDTGFVGMRVPVMFSLLLFAGLLPTAPRRTGIVVPAALAAVLLVRVGGTATVWHRQAEDVAMLRATIAQVQPGARVLPAVAVDQTSPAYLATAPVNRVLRGYAPLSTHLPALLLIEHDAFWPMMFTARTKQPLFVRPPYDAFAAPQNWLPTLVALADPNGVHPAGQPTYLAHWPDNFDYVLLLEPFAAGDPAKVLPDRLALLTANAESALYRVRRATP